jgi:hypothetical protein
MKHFERFHDDQDKDKNQKYIISFVLLVLYGEKTAFSESKKVFLFVTGTWASHLTHRSKNSASLKKRMMEESVTCHYVLSLYWLFI